MRPYRSVPEYGYNHCHRHRQHGPRPHRYCRTCRMFERWMEEGR